MHEAEQFAAEDKKRKEEVEIRNNAEQLVFQSEKALSDLGDKIDASEKSAVESEIEKVKEALKGTDSEMIKMASEGLSKKFGEIAQGDKIDASEKSAVESEIEKVKEALKGTDSEMIKMASEGLSKKFGEIAQKVYAQQAPQGDPNMGAQKVYAQQAPQGDPNMGGQGFQGGAQQSGPQGDFVDADFTEVKDDDNK